MINKPITLEQLRKGLVDMLEAHNMTIEQFQAMHIDPQLTEVGNFVRYTMFLQDWEPGHIFVWDDQYISNYKAGDMYEWSDPMTVHGPANIGYNTRYTLQITMYD